MKRRALLVAGVGVLGGCLQDGAENRQGSGETDHEEDGNGTDQEIGSNGTDDEFDSNTTDQDDTATETGQDDSENRSDPANESTETEQSDTSNGTAQDNTTNGSAQEADGNRTEQNDARETRSYEIEDKTSSESPIRHEFEMTQPDIHSPDAPLTFTVSISNRTDETIRYGETRSVVGKYLKSGVFILVPKGEHEYSFDEEERMWLAPETISFGDIYGVDELEPDETRSQELVLIRVPHKEFPDTVPSEFEFTTTLSVEDEDADENTESKYTVAFSLVAP